MAQVLSLSVQMGLPLWAQPCIGGVGPRAITCASQVRGGMVSASRKCDLTPAARCGMIVAFNGGLSRWL